MLNNIIARVESYTSEMHRKKIQNYVTLNDALKNAGIFVPGCAFNSSQRSFWQLPLLVSNKLQFREFAQLNGCNVFRGSTQVKLVAVPEKRFSKPKPDYIGAPNCLFFTSHMVFLPVHSDISSADMAKVTDLTVDVCTRYSLYLKQLENQTLNDIRPKALDEEEGPLAKL